MATVIYGAGHAGTQIFNNLPNEVKAEVFLLMMTKKSINQKFSTAKFLVLIILRNVLKMNL